jgi:hypothetical protein
MIVITIKYGGMLIYKGGTCTKGGKKKKEFFKDKRAVNQRVW